jgi:hypothetical protein
VPLRLAYPQVRVHERPGSSWRAMVRRQDAGATTQPGRVWDPPLPRQDHSPFAGAAVQPAGRSNAAPLRLRRLAARAGLGPAPTRASTVHHSLFAIRYSPFFSIRHSPSFAARRSPLAVFHHPPLATRHSPLAVFPHSPFAVFLRSPSFSAPPEGVPVLRVEGPLGGC